MDDFLHNLRSGKLKQQDRGRSYNDPQYKRGQGRIAQDRRKKELEAFERLNAVKEVLETISGTQKRMAEAYEARTQAEHRKARAMEVLAKNIYSMLNPEADDADTLFDSDPISALALGSAAEPDNNGASTAAVSNVDTQSTSESKKTTDTNSDPESRKLSDTERQTLFKLINGMRDEGNKWEQIARHIAAQGYPTISGKGIWRGVMAKNLYEKMNAQ